MAFNTALVVDDSKLARITLRKLLKKKNINEVTMVGSAQEAFEILETSLPDIIFMDHMMPDMDGFEATKIIKANPHTSHIPIIMCTGKEDANYLDLALAAGASGMLSKPPISSDLHKVLDATPPPATPTTVARKSAPRIMTEEDDEPKPVRSAAPATAASKQEIENMVGSQVRKLLASLQQEITDQVEHSLKEFLEQSLENTVPKLISKQLIEQLDKLPISESIAAEAKVAAPIDETALLEKLESKIERIVIPKTEEAVKKALDLKLTTAVDEATNKLSGQIKTDLGKQLKASNDESIKNAVEKAVSQIEFPSTSANDENFIQQLASLNAQLSALKETIPAAINVNNIVEQVTAKLAEANTPDINEITHSVRQTLATELADFITSNKQEIDINDVIEQVKSALHDNTEELSVAPAAELSSELMEEIVELIKRQSTSITEELIDEKLQPVSVRIEQAIENTAKIDLESIRQEAMQQAVNAAKELLEKIQAEGDSDQVISALAALNNQGVANKELMDKMTKLESLTEKFYWAVGLSFVGLLTLAIVAM